MQLVGRGAQGDQVAVHVATASVAVVVVIVVVAPPLPPAQVCTSYKPLPVHDAISPSHQVKEKCKHVHRIRRMLATQPLL